MVPDVSSQITTVAAHFAELLCGDFEVVVLGPDLGRGISDLHKQCRFIRPIGEPRIYRLPEFIPGVMRIARALEGAGVVVAFKAYLDTVLPALMARKRWGIPIVVYLDELDSAVLVGKKAAERILLWLKDFYHPLEDAYFPVAEYLAKRADRIVCSSRTLASRVNGEVVYFGVDTEHFRPQPESTVQRLRSRYGLDGLSCIVFAGAVRPHKGVEQILAAVQESGLGHLRLVVVGPETEYLKELMAGPNGHLIVYLGPVARQEVPKYLGLSDMVVLPLQDTPLGRTQVPCKVFEAMGMAKPIIATAVSDLPEILDGCGILVPPDNVAAMAQAIRELSEDPQRAAELGRAARRRCEQRYSASQTRERWLNLIASLEDETSAR